jgi:hypothetical protein
MISGRRRHHRDRRSISLRNASNSSETVIIHL